MYIDPEELYQLDPFEKAELDMQLDEEADDYLEMYTQEIANKNKSNDGWFGMIKTN